MARSGDAAPAGVPPAVAAANLSTEHVLPAVVGAPSLQEGSCPEPARAPARPEEAEAGEGVAFPGASAATEANGTSILGLDFSGLWRGGWEEFVDEDMEVVGDAYEAGVLGGVLATEDAKDIPRQEQQAEGNAPEAKRKTISVTGFISNFVLSIIGSTTLGLASQMRVGGFLAAPLLVGVGCAIVSENTWLLCATMDRLQSQGVTGIAAYPDFAKAAFGIWGRRVASVTSMCALVGMTCTSLVLEAQNFSFVLPIAWPWLGCIHCGQKWWALFLTPFCLLYCFVDTAKLLKKSAFLGPIVCLMTVVLAWIGAGSSITGAGEFPHTCRISRKPVPRLGEFLQANELVQLAQVGSYGFYSFAVIVTVPSLRGQMKHKEKAAPAAILAYLICLAMFIPIMLLAYIGFGDLVPQNLVDGMRKDRPLGWWALNRPWETGAIATTGVALDLVVTLNLMLTEAIYIPCTVMAIEASFPQLFRSGPSWARAALRMGYTAFRLLVATTFNGFVAMSALVSSLFCVCNNIVFPIVAFHWTGAREVSTLRKCMHALVLVYGLFIMVFGTYGAVQSLTPHGVEEPGIHLREDISPECVAAFHAANGSLS